MLHNNSLSPEQQQHSLSNKLLSALTSDHRNKTENIFLSAERFAKNTMNETFFANGTRSGERIFFNY